MKKIQVNSLLGKETNTKMLHKLNKDELILIIEFINKNHKKEIDRIKDEHETVIDACKELYVKFKQCSVKSCKAMRIKRGGNSDSYKDVNCNDLSRCGSCNQYICDKHLQNCQCYETH